jgi:hypothetical protein
MEEDSSDSQLRRGGTNAAEAVSRGQPIWEGGSIHAPPKLPKRVGGSSLWAVETEESDSRFSVPATSRSVDPQPSWGPSRPPRRAGSPYSRSGGGGLSLDGGHHLGATHPASGNHGGSSDVIAAMVEVTSTRTFSSPAKDPGLSTTLRLAGWG